MNTREFANELWSQLQAWTTGGSPNSRSAVFLSVTTVRGNFVCEILLSDQLYDYTILGVATNQLSAEISALSKALAKTNEIFDQ